MIPSLALARISSAASSPTSARPPTWPRYALPAFTLVSVLNLMFEVAGPRLAFDLTKPLLMPLLALSMLATGRATPRLLLGALLGAFVGDTMLLFSGSLFLVGMAGFACGTSETRPLGLTWFTLRLRIR